MPIGEQEQQAKDIGTRYGVAAPELYALRDQPEVWIRVAAFVRRALGRQVELQERAGFIDPHIRVGDASYSLLRDEGHGLRELVVLLAAIYSPGWNVLVVDEPELHVHPSMARLWLAELQRGCRETRRRAVVVTHEPSLVRPASVDELEAVWHFAPGRAPARLSDCVHDRAQDRVAASLVRNPELVSQLVFAPRPVLVEGTTDVAALRTALQRTRPPEAVAQTDLVDCGGSSGVALWFEIACRLGLDVRAVADLDALFDTSVRRAMDRMPKVIARYRNEIAIEPATTAEAVRSISERMGRERVPSEPRSKAGWLASLVDDGHAARRDALLRIWRDVGLWLHPQGRLEQVLGIDDKGMAATVEAAAVAGAIDAVAEWCAFELDATGEIETLLNATVERIAHEIMEALRLNPDAHFSFPAGPSAQSDAELVEVRPIAAGVHRITVRTPKKFEGWWLEFSRETASQALTLQPPAAAAGQS